MTESMSMPEGEFQAIAFFTGEDMGGRVWVCLTQPRLRFRDTFYRSGECNREWLVDGDDVVSREEADERLKTAPRLGADEASVLATIGKDWTAKGQLVPVLDPDPQATSPQERLDAVIEKLIEKGLIDEGRSGVRLHRAWKKPPDPELQRRNDPADPVYFHRGSTDVAVDEEIRKLAPELDLKLRLVPVLTWPERWVPSHLPTFRGKIDMGALDDANALMQVILTLMQGSRNLNTPKILDGCCILVEDGGAGRVLFEPKIRVGLRDIASWQAAAAGTPLLPHQMRDARTGWMKLNIGDWLTVLPQGDRVYLGTTGDFDGLPLGPFRGWPIWNVATDALRAAVDEATNVIDRVAAGLDHCLQYDVADERRPAVISRMIRPSIIEPEDDTPV